MARSTKSTTTDDGTETIRLAHFWQDHQPGDEITVPAALAVELDRAGYVERDVDAEGGNPTATSADTATQ